MNKKVVWLPYDMDTAIGINNEGTLTFSYNLEDIDTTESGADVYNGQQSVIWNNIRNAFSEELASMYRTLRSTGALSYDKVERAFEEHQDKWCEAIFNEDAWFKYIDPLINSGTGSYLSMMQGSKEEQRKWWLYNRFRYIDSKYNAGDALSDLIQIRGYAKSNVTVTPYADIYPSVKYGSYLVQERGIRNVPTTLVCPLDNVNDTEIYIYSASQLASVGDLSGFKVGFADFSMATKIQSIKIGDVSASYDNANLTSLTLGNNTLLKTLDVRNCSALSTTVDISGCEIIENVYFDGTSITGVTLPNGGVLKVLHLPETITNLTIMNQSAITDLTIGGYNNISTLRLENVPTIDSKEILESIPIASRVRLIGFSWEATDSTEIENLLNLLDSMRGLDENGNNMDTAQVSGIIHTTSLTGAQIASYNTRYPYLTVTADHTTSYLYYYSYDGTQLLHTETIYDGGNGTYNGTPGRTSDAQYNYTFAGWATSPNGNANANATKGIVADRNVYAAYTKTVRTYTVYFYNGSTLLETDRNVPYGGSTTYNGSTPVSSEGSAEDYPFEGWKPAPTNIHGDTSCYAQFGSPVVVEEITDSWEVIIANIDNGDYKTRYKLGNYKPLDLGAQGTINMQIVAMDADELANGGNAPLTFIGKELLKSTHAMKSNGSTAGWYENTDMRTYLNTTILSLMPSNVASRLQRVKKVQNTYENGSIVYNGQTSIERVWIPSYREIIAGTEEETNGVRYDKFYKGSYRERSKFVVDEGSKDWWTRTAKTSTTYAIITSSGWYNHNPPQGRNYICLGFCLGLEPETITDTWEQIFEAEADGTYSTKYSIGDTKELDLGTEGRQLMEIVAFDTDDKADGSGKAKITWISKGLLNTAHRINPFKVENTEGTGTLGGWEKSEMRTYLKETIKPLIPSEVRNNIVEVTKVSKAYKASDETDYQQVTSDDLWIPSYKEIRGYQFPSETSYESTGAAYSRFINSGSRIKKTSGSTQVWWTRSANNAAKFAFINGSGDPGFNPSNLNYYIALGFCT